MFVAASEMNGQPSLPGCLPGVISVNLDWDCPRETYRCAIADSEAVFLASGYPRPIPGAPPERNLNGISFAVANMAGFIARAREAFSSSSIDELESALIQYSVNKFI